MLSHAIFAYRKFKKFFCEFLQGFFGHRTGVLKSEIDIGGVSCPLRDVSSYLLHFYLSSYRLFGAYCLCYHNNRSWSEGAIVNARSVSFTNCSLTRNLCVLDLATTLDRDKLNHFKEPSLDLSCILEFVIIFGPKCQNPAGSF